MVDVFQYLVEFLNCGPRIRNFVPIQICKSVIDQVGFDIDGGDMHKGLLIQDDLVVSTTALALCNMIRTHRIYFGHKSQGKRRMLWIECSPLGWQYEIP